MTFNWQKCSKRILLNKSTNIFRINTKYFFGKSSYFTEIFTKIQRIRACYCLSMSVCCCCSNPTSWRESSTVTHTLSQNVLLFSCIRGTSFFIISSFLVLRISRIFASWGKLDTPRLKHKDSKFLIIFISKISFEF